ncbi:MULTISPECIES: hemerythrin domain-containing protein [Sphingomonas]|uniref:Uncharacterized protein n=1 Tax=Sphingomonas leidyi TaxID=68569 RepID=A0A7X5V011_9SPHN|nr:MULTISPECIES: hemerythrin domain-containing protein [Sphingomonas]MBN8813176.1 hemerythrin domain-containing protein [Sphingomonas sp.]NIJ64742.1 hypothetical protein [Sphingomonas leidyi]OJY53494.1 MAG: hypothetical protein BGP17_10285 [Sphingomonas sp. 67-41]
MPVDRVLRQHGHILANADALEALVSGPRPASIEGLGFRRWLFTRDLLMHFARMEGQVYGPLMDEVGGEVAHMASHASAETAALVADFREHVTRWHGFPSEAQWGIYARSTRWLTARIRERLESEATDILPLLSRLPVDDQGACPGKPDHRYVADAWEIRELIFGAKPRVEPPRVGSVPEDQDQKDDRNRDAEQPQQDALAHIKPPSIWFRLRK